MYRLAGHRGLSHSQSRDLQVWWREVVGEQPTQGHYIVARVRVEPGKVSRKTHRYSTMSLSYSCNKGQLCVSALTVTA